MHRVKVVVVDIGNVLIKADHALTWDYLSKQGIDSEKAKLFYQIGAYSNFSRGWLAPVQFADSLRLALRVDWSDEELRKAHDIHLCDVDERVLNLVKSVKLPVVIATDTNYWQTRRERELIDVSTFAKVIFRSHEIGLLKRDARTFEALAYHLTNRFNTAKSQIVLVDDMPDICQLATSFGFRVIQFQNAAQLEKELGELKII